MDVYLCCICHLSNLISDYTPGLSRVDYPNRNINVLLY